MSKQLHKSQEITQPSHLTHDDTRMHTLKQNMLGFYGISKLGRRPKDSTLANSPIDTKNVDKPVQKKKTITKKIDWSSDDYFPLLKYAVDSYLNRDIKQGSLLTNIVVPEHILKRSAAIFS